MGVNENSEDIAAFDTDEYIGGRPMNISVATLREPLNAHLINNTGGRRQSPVVKGNNGLLLGRTARSLWGLGIPGVERLSALLKYESSVMV